MSAFTDRINTILEALGDDATPDVIANATRAFEARDVLAVVYARTDAAGEGGGLPDEWTVTEDGAVTFPAEQPDGTFADAPFALGERDTGIVVNRTGGFVSEWETFDLGRPGVGYGKLLFTAADADGETWVDTIVPTAEVSVSANGSTWVPVYGAGAATGAAVTLDASAAAAADPVGDALAYVAITPRHIRFRIVLSDAQSGEVYDGANDPSLTFTLDYAAG